ncbi:hypothetical protein [Actinacidiphila sp. ITFR-21]|uniref:hypothetical protein n=1 Tax=Actinacidiphila sp. ITFR-21 TaxID=3075199 RepID=UPI00288A2121|nr:hypothetical protein [Streptomyces sp. ITFR-21]WNI14241.1 hypothetical protein RLT57_00975 [Streptomyces sp. ITFR-21]
MSADPTLRSVAEILVPGAVPALDGEAALLREALDILQQARITSLVVDAAHGSAVRGLEPDAVADALAALHPELGRLIGEHFAVARLALDALRRDAHGGVRRLVGDVGRGLLAGAAPAARLDWREPEGNGDLLATGTVGPRPAPAHVDVILVPLPAAGPVRPVAAVPTYRQGISTDESGLVRFDGVTVLREEVLGLDRDEVARVVAPWHGGGR